MRRFVVVFLASVVLIHLCDAARGLLSPLVGATTAWWIESLLFAVPLTCLSRFLFTEIKHS